MNLEIITYERVGPIAFGMSADTIRSTLKVSYREFKRTPIAKTTTDAFPQLGVFICYTPDRICNAVEMGLRAQPTFQGVKVIGCPVREVRRWLEELDGNLAFTTAGITSVKLGLGVFSSALQKDPNAMVEGVIAFAKGYFDVKGS